MSAPRTNAAIADELKRILDKPAEVFDGYLRIVWDPEDYEAIMEAAAALRKEPPAPHFSLQEREMTQAEADALDRIAAAPSPLEGVTLKRVPLQPPALPAEGDKIHARLSVKVGGWSVICEGHAAEHVCLATSILCTAVGAALDSLATVYPDEIELTVEDKT